MLHPDKLVELGEREAREEHAQLESWQHAREIDLTKRQSHIPDIETTALLLKWSSFFLSTSTMWPADIVLRVLITTHGAWLANSVKTELRNRYLLEVATQYLRSTGAWAENLLEQAKQTESGNIAIVMYAWKSGRDLATDPEAQEALAFLAESLPLRLMSQQERDSLRDLALREGKSRAVARRDIIIEALIEAFLLGDTPTSYRVPGTGFLVDGTGKHQMLAPYAANFPLYVWWLRKEAAQIARNNLGGRAPASAHITSPNSPSEVEMILARAPDIQSLQALLDAPEAEELRTLLQQAGGTDKERAAWLLRHNHGLSSTEIARAWGSAPGTVRHHIYDMKRKLTSYLSQTPA
jgi:hypothetical protein